MIPPRSFPQGTLKLVEVENGEIVKTHRELTNSMSDRKRIQDLRENLLMSYPGLDLQVIENNAF